MIYLSIEDRARLLALIDALMRAPGSPGRAEITLFADLYDRLKHENVPA